MTTESRVDRTYVRSSDLHTLFRCYRLLKPYIGWVIVGALALVAMGGVDLLVPQVMRRTVDQGIIGGNLSLLGTGAVSLLVLILIKGIITFIQGRLIERSAQGVAYDLRRTIHERLTSLSFSFHDQSESGQLLSRSIQDVERIRFLAGRASLRLLESIVLLGATAGIMFSMNSLLASMAVLMMPLLVWRAVVFGKTIRPLAQKEREQLAVLTTVLDQNLRGARIVKAFAQEHREIARFQEENRRWFGIATQEAKVSAVNGPLLTTIVQLASVAILSVGGVLIVRGQLSFGELVAFSAYLAQLARPVRMLGMIVPMVGMATASAERIFEIVDATSEVQEDQNAPELPHITGAVTLDNVSFAYPGRGKALHDVSIEVEPGQVIALLGETGSGKSTVVNLIPRFYDVSSGSVKVDGYDVREVRLSSLRQQIGIVLQESTLFASSIRENIRYGRPEATDAQVEAAAQAAQAHAFISSMPRGYETEVGEQGKTLSGGQRQRVAIARAILKDPRILVLDDATSSVDTETERLIQDALGNLMEGRTSFVIAQRLSTLRMADRVIVVADGQIAAEGTHTELWERSELYRQIYQRQLKQDVSEEGIDAR